MAHAYNPNYSGGRDQEDKGLRLARAKSKPLSQKYQAHERAGGVAKAVEHLPSKCETLIPTLLPQREGEPQ
jgi:hypothetical protein